MSRPKARRSVPVLDSVRLGRFKSFSESVLSLSELTLLIGKNGSGKSNASNHIHHVGDGRARRRCATTFAGMLDLSARGEAPWVLHDATWDAELLDAIRTGSTTGSDLVEHATRGDEVGLGCGDMSVLAERDLYRRRRVDPRAVEVRIWSADALLQSFAGV